MEWYIIVWLYVAGAINLGAALHLSGMPVSRYYFLAQIFWPAYTLWVLIKAIVEASLKSKPE